MSFSETCRRRGSNHTPEGNTMAGASALARDLRAEWWFKSALTPSRMPVSGSTVKAEHQSHIQATALTPSQLAEAKNAFTKLDGASLTEAVRFYLAHAKPASGTKKFEEAIDALLK